MRLILLVIAAMIWFMSPVYAGPYDSDSGNAPDTSDGADVAESSPETDEEVGPEAGRMNGGSQSE